MDRRRIAWAVPWALLLAVWCLAGTALAGDKPPPQDCDKGFAYCCDNGDCLRGIAPRLGTVYFDRCWKWKPPGCWPCSSDGWFKIWETCVAKYPQVPQDRMEVCTDYYWKYDFCYKVRPSGRPEPKLPK